MALTAKGLIVREHQVGEADRFVTILTDTFGVIRASVRGARRVNSRAGASTRMFSYSRFSLVKGREKYIVDTASPERMFFASGGSVEQISLAQYFCELITAVAPREDEATDFLRLLLNALHLLEKGNDIDRIKAVLELRALCLAGYMPDLHGCRCAKNTMPPFFDPSSGVLCCAACQTADAVPLTKTVYDALCHIVHGDEAKCFSFQLPAEETIRLADIAERFVTNQLSRRFQTLEFYHTVADMTV